LAGDRIGISPMYPSPVHRIQELAGMFDPSNFEGAEQISATLVTLPTHILLKEKDRAKVCDTVLNLPLDGKKIEHGQPQRVGCK